MPENTTPRERLEVLAHPLRVDDHAAHDAREAPQHVIERDEAVGQDDALDRRVRDVALVPERDVLERRVALPRSSRARPTICSQPIGLRLCGIADEPFWPLRERLLDLADLGLLQAANLERELLERRRR